MFLPLRVNSGPRTGIQAVREKEWDEKRKA